MASRGKVLLLVENLSVPFDQRVWREAVALADIGYQVSVVCPKGDRYDTERHVTIKGISIYRYNAFEAREGLAAYFLEYMQAIMKLSFWSWIVLFREGFHVVQICNPPDLLFLVVWPFKLMGKSVIFDHHDLSPETYQSKRKDYSSNAVHKLLLVFERWTFKIADVVMTTNESYRRIALGRGGVSEDDVVVVRNGPDLERVVEVPENPELRNGKDHLLFYVGTMGSQDGVDYLLRAVRHLVHDRKRTDFHTLIMGGGAELETLKELACELDIDNVVTFTGRVSDETLVEGLSTADICICPDPKMPLNDISTMNKTMEYMALGKPVVAFDLIETRVSAGDAALYADSDNESDLATKINELLDDRELRATLGKIGRERIHNGLSWDHSKPHLYKAYRLAFGKARKESLALPNETAKS